MLLPRAFSGGSDGKEYACNARVKKVMECARTWRRARTEGLSILPHPGCAGGQDCVRVSQLNQKYPRRSETSPQVRTYSSYAQNVQLDFSVALAGPPEGPEKPTASSEAGHRGPGPAACAETLSQSPCGTRLLTAHSWSPSRPELSWALSRAG